MVAIESAVKKSEKWRQAHADWEPHLGAVLDVDDNEVRALDLDRGPLSGLAVGVKDVIDVAGMPTRNGSKTGSTATPATEDADVVAALRRAGASIVCKTATTEFAFIDPTGTKNPFNPERTPGGSSSGSGAVVGAGLLDIAVGTQTAGSLCRPASYCGCVGFKPTFGALSTRGMTPLSPAFDTIGFIARTVDLAGRAFAASGGTPGTDIDLSSLRIGLPPIDRNASMERSAIDSLHGAVEALRKSGAAVEPTMVELPFADLIADHRTVMLHEASRAHGALLESGKLQPLFAHGLEEGLSISEDAANAALHRLQSAAQAFWRNVADFDLLLTPPVPGPAPMRAEGTGYQHLLTPWTVLGGPLLCLPWGTDGAGLPLSVMLAAPPRQDRIVLGAGDALSRLAPLTPKPIPPA